MSGGTYSAADLAVGWTNPGTSAVGTGAMNLSGGTFESRAATFVGLEGATGTVNISGGTFNSGGNSWGSFRIADYGTGTGTLNLSGTGVVNAALYTAVGGWGNGTLNISGGTWNQASGGIVVGDAGDLSWAGRGDVNQSGGTVNADYVLLQKGTYNLDGGYLSTAGVADTKAETTGVLNLNGGWLMATGSNSNFITADTVEIKAGGVVMHTREHDVTVTKGMQGVGGLSKGGSGTLRLTGANSYAGYTTVVEGKLVVSGSIISNNNNAFVIVESVNSANPNPPEIEIVDGATMTFAGPFGLGWSAGSSGKFIQSGGSVSVTNDQMILADSANSVGMAEISGGTLSVAKTTVVGRMGSGTLNIFGGTLNAGTDVLGSFRIGDRFGGPGTMSLGGTGVVNAPNYTAVGGWGNGTLNISGGTWNQEAGGIVVGDAADLNWTGQGEVNQSNGTVNTDYVFLQKGTYNLNGGILSTYGVADTKAETTGVFNFNGGTLRARDNNADFITADTVEIKSGGATIDTADNEVWITKGMMGSGGLTKKGLGILKLAGVNSYAGATTVQQGTLRMEAANFIADATSSNLTVVFTSAPADGQLTIFPGTLNGNPSVSFTGLAAGQTGSFSPLSGKATFTTTSTGVSFSTWSGGQPLTSELLGKYAIGGATSPSAVSARSVLTSTGGVLTLSALVRINSSASSFAVIGECSTDLVSWSPLPTNPAGTPSSNTSNVPEGFQRKDFNLPAGYNKMFLRLKSTY